MAGELFKNNKERSNFAKGAAQVSDDYKNKRNVVSGMQDTPAVPDGLQTVSAASIHNYLNNANSKDTAPGKSNHVARGK